MKIRKVDNNYEFECPGCGYRHTINTSWTFNQNFNLPTFQPSVLLRGGHYSENYKPGDNCWCTYNKEQISKGEPVAPFECVICHSFIVDGNIQFLNDCTHRFAGQTLPLPEIE